jgi:hypothetical protein
VVNRWAVTSMKNLAFTALMLALGVGVWAGVIQFTTEFGRGFVQSLGLYLSGGVVGYFVGRGAERRSRIASS